MFSFKVTVDPKIEKTIRELMRRYPEAAGAALYDEAVGILRDAAARAPGDTGSLAQSGYVTTPGGPTQPIEAGFGAPYAIVQHERTDYHHAKGEAKYLERAVDTRLSGMLLRIGARVDQLSRSRGTPSATSEFPPTPRQGDAHPGGRRRRFRAVAARVRRRRG